MGMYTSTYVTYGLHVPSDKYDHLYDETDRLDAIIGALRVPSHISLGHLSAGDYDRNELFLSVGPKYNREDPLTRTEVELGTFRRYPASWFEGEQRREWDTYLTQLAAAAGYGDLGEPGWLVIPDVS